jgi:hypothetical protein
MRYLSIWINLNTIENTRVHKSRIGMFQSLFRYTDRPIHGFCMRRSRQFIINNEAQILNIYFLNNIVIATQ